MAALQTRRFAAEGYAVLQVDLTGCGDSRGDFGEATWEAWRSDVSSAHAWLLAKANSSIFLWGLRMGASLIVEMANVLPNIQGVLLWHPILNGEQFLNQFLRIKLASEMLSVGQTQNGTKDLRAKLEAGESIEVGGNLLNAKMARGLTGIKLVNLSPSCPVEWIEIGIEESDAVTPASQRVLDTWRKTGVSVEACTVLGEPFWATQEITECPKVIDASIHSVCRLL